MKTFAFSSLLVLFLLSGSTLLADDVPPWHWDEEEPAYEQPEEEKPTATEELESDIGW